MTGQPPGEQPAQSANGHDSQQHPLTNLPLLDTILEFVNAEDWEQSRSILNRNPMLLSETAQQTFAALIQNYLAQNELRLAYHLAIHRDLLRHARELGYDRAFELVSTPPSETLVRVIAEFMQASDWAASREVLRHHPELLSHEANVAFQALIQAAIEADDQPRIEALISHHELLRAAQELGADEAFRRAEAAESGESTDLMLLSVIGHNTIAVMLNEVEQREEWRESVLQLQRDARAEGDASLVALLSAILKLLQGRPVSEIKAGKMSPAHDAVWAQITAALGGAG